MSAIQQIKNFIRHGRAAVPRDEHAKQGRSTSASTEDEAARRQRKAEAAAAAATSRSKRATEDAIAELVASENKAKSQFPVYPGLEEWRLVQKMGDGAFSNVYRAQSIKDASQEVAIKVVRRYEMSSMQRANILKEVQIMRQLDHPNIVKLVNFIEEKHHYYIILELAPGGELFHQIVRLTYFSEDLSRHVIVQVAKALEYLHEERGVVHRDIKPENILFVPTDFVPSSTPSRPQPGDEDKVDEGQFVPGVGAGGIGLIKIADFGLSKVVWDTQTKTPCGTVGYTAPEIVKDERYSKSVDMWALGCVLYTLLCGFPPFYDENLDALTAKVARGQYTFLSPWWDNISASAKDLITHLLTVDSNQRYTITQFLNHPWVRNEVPVSHTPATAPPVFDTGIKDGSRHDFRSPGAVNLREVFDVGYAVHRQEEEAKIRREIGAKGGPADVLDEVAEEDEDAAADDNSTNAITKGVKKVNLDANARGYGQHSARVTAIGRQAVRDHDRENGVFELSLNGATLLGRRGKPAQK